MKVLSRSALVAATAVVALGLSACTGLPGTRTTSTAKVPSQAPPSGVVGLEKFYDQKLEWRSCGSNQCTKLTVPIDYAAPDGDTFQLAVIKVPAKGTSQGALVVNPGGPGGSGIDYAVAADFIVGAPVRKAFDIVGFDPRGVGRSKPIDCVSDAKLDAFLAQDPTPDDPAEEQTFQTNAKNFADECAAGGGPLLRNVATVDAAKDMDILRVALGETKLNYLGKSYGTYLGAVYAGLFPKQVGRFVLDGVLAPELTQAEISLGQAKGFERATEAWAQWCVDEGDCPLGTSKEEVLQGLTDLFKTLDTSPIRNTGDPSVPLLTEGWGSTGVAQAMYDKSLWPQLVDALRLVIDSQDGSGLMDLANQYAERNRGGGYSNNIMQAYFAVSCLDRPEPDGIPAHEQLAKETSAVAPVWGRFMAWGSMTCSFWQDKPTANPTTISAEGSDLIVVVGTTRDPATPYEWSVMLDKELANSTLISFDGDGHTAYQSSTPSACVDDAIDAYYVSGTAPQPDLKC